MILWHLVILSIVQGFSEPWPISSSGHLALAHHLLGDNLEENASVARQLDIAVHIGTFLALLIYFWRDVLAMARGGVNILQGRFHDPDGRMALFLVVATIPAVIAGYFVAKLDPAVFYDLTRLAFALLGFGLLLGVADKFFPQDKHLEDMNFKRALLFGLAQILALMPGVSRSGITMTMGRFLGFDRIAAAKFSFLMAMIATAGAGVIATAEVVQAGDYSLGTQYVVAIFLSFITTLGAVYILMKWLQRYSFMPFVVYRVILGVGILLALQFGILA